MLLLRHFRATNPMKVVFSSAFGYQANFGKRQNGAATLPARNNNWEEQKTEKIKLNEELRHCKASLPNLTVIGYEIIANAVSGTMKFCINVCCFAIEWSSTSLLFWFLCNCIYIPYLCFVRPCLRGVQSGGEVRPGQPARDVWGTNQNPNTEIFVNRIEICTAGAPK